MAHLSEEPDPEPVTTHYPSPSLLPLPGSVLFQCHPLSGTARVGAVALGMPGVPASLYHSCRSLHRSWLLLSQLYFLCRSIERGLPPAPCSWNWNFAWSPTGSVSYSALPTLSFSGEMVDSSQKASKSFSTYMEDEFTFDIFSNGVSLSLNAF